MGLTWRRHLMQWIDDLAHDVRYGTRVLRNMRGLTAIAVLTLALGIGAATAISSVVDAILLQPLPFANADRLVRLVENVPLPPAGRPPWQRGATYQEFLDWQGRVTTLSGLIAVSSSQALVKTNEGTARLWGSMTSATTFTLLGTRAMLGRTYGAGDAENPDVVVLAYDTWRRLFHSDRDVIGRTLEFLRPADRGSQPMTIIGVLPPNVEFPPGRSDFYRPLALDGQANRFIRFSVFGWLRPGVTLDAARQEANTIGTAITPPLPADAPPMSVPRFQIDGLKDHTVAELRPALRVFLAGVFVVLMIVCANVANLLLARGTARHREIALRAAIGATRGRIVRQVLTECLLLAGIGGTLGALLGAAGVALVRDLASVDAPGIFRFAFGASILPRIGEVGVNLRTLGIAFVIATATSLAFGVLPALHSVRVSRLHALGSRTASAGRAASRLRALLVVGQLVLATMLLTGAGLLIHSLVKLTAVDRGFDSGNVVALQLVFPPAYPIARKVEGIESVLSRLRASPEVEAAGFTRAGLLIGEEITLGTFVPDGRTIAEMRAYPEWPRVRPVSDGFLTATGARLLEGRDIGPLDRSVSMPAIVVDRIVAQRFAGQGSAVGQVVEWHMGKGPTTRVQVVGVVESLRNTSPARQPYPEIFIDFRDLLALQQQWGESELWQTERSLGLLSFAVRARGNPAATVPAITRVIRSADSNAGIDAIVPMDRLVANSVARPRFYATLLGVFAGVAALLAAIGIYGVLAYAVAQRTQEIGIRMALGAQRSQVLALVLRHGFALTAIGLTVGLAGAAAVTRYLQGMLFGVTPLDPKTFAAVSSLFALVAALASYLPARRATTIDPIVALKTD